MKYLSILAKWPEANSAMFTDMAQNMTIRQTRIPSRYVRDPIYLDKYEVLENALTKAAEATHLSKTSPDTRTTKSEASVNLRALEVEQENSSDSYLLVRQQYWQPLQSFYLPRGGKQQIRLEYQTGISPTDQANLRRILGLEIGPEMHTTDEGTEPTLALQVKFMFRDALPARFNSKEIQRQIISELQLKPAIFMRVPDESAVDQNYTHWAHHKGTFVAYWQLIDQFILTRADDTIVTQATFRGLSAVPVMR